MPLDKLRKMEGLVCFVFVFVCLFFFSKKLVLLLEGCPVSLHLEVLSMQFPCICLQVSFLECLDFGEASSACGTIRRGVASRPSGLNIRQAHLNQGIQLLKV